MSFCWTHYDDNEKKYFLNTPISNIEDVRRLCDEIKNAKGHLYLPKPVSIVAHLVSQGDVIDLSDFDAISRFEPYKLGSKIIGGRKIRTLDGG